MQRGRKNVRNSEMFEIAVFELSSINYKRSFLRKTLGKFCSKQRKFELSSIRNSGRVLYICAVMHRLNARGVY